MYTCACCPQMSDSEILFDDPSATIFKYVQQLLSQTQGTAKGEKLKRIWEPTYVYVLCISSSHHYYTVTQK